MSSPTSKGNILDDKASSLPSSPASLGSDPTRGTDGVGNFRVIEDYPLRNSTAPVFWFEVHYAFQITGDKSGQKPADIAAAIKGHLGRDEMAEVANIVLGGDVKINVHNKNLTNLANTLATLRQFSPSEE